MELQTVVVGHDFSDASAAAARWVADHFARDAALVLAHAVHMTGPPSFLRPIFRSAAERADTAATDALARLAEFRDALRPDARVEVVAGRPAHAIPRLAERSGADLIAIGAHGYRTDDRLGTTADELVRLSERPVLVARDLPPAAPEHIIVAVDDSDLTGPVLDWGAGLARRFEARATVLHALDAGELAEARLAGSGAPDDESEPVDRAREWLESRVRAVNFAPGSYRTEVVFGDPAHEIVTRTRQNAADLVVMGSRGAGAIGRALLGSVASLVLRNAYCPVLVV